MIQDSSPITPPPELVEQWECEYHLTYGPDLSIFISEKAARWGADQELDACCEWLLRSLPGYDKHYADYLRAARRPKPPSLKELNLKHLEVMERDGHYLPEIIADLRRAIESLPS